ncbi:MAG: hypothetical protein QM704_14235 [Anaeromyxobacteraceae bacterium]
MKGLAWLTACLALAGAGCAALPEQPAGGVTSPDEKKCAFDAECPGGSCRYGRCSTQAAEKRCAFDTECLGGACTFGRCTTLMASEANCAFDTQCLGGSCQLGRCSPARRACVSDVQCQGGMRCHAGSCSF